MTELMCLTCKRPYEGVDCPTCARHDVYRPGVLADWQIEELCQGETPMIEPFVPKPVRQLAPPDDGSLNLPYDPRKVISYGLGHYGYDMRVSDEFRVFTNVHTTIVDPKQMDEKSFVEIKGTCIIPPNSFTLARSVERFQIPRSVFATIIGKSSYARCGIIINCTPLEPEWRGYVTLEISNTTPNPARIHANEGIAQVVFNWASAQCRTSYDDKGGKYQDQPAKIVLSRM